MEFNQFIGPESADREYKLGVMYWNREFSFDELVYLLKTGKWIFNDCTHNTIRVYLEKYLSKYIAAFSNRLSSINKGKLYIGIDDNGYVKGIPYKGKLSLTSITPIVNKIIDNMMSFSNKMISSHIKQNIKIEIIDVTFKMKLNIIRNIQYENFLDTYQKRKKILDQYNYRKNKWAKIIESQTSKLYRNLNNERYIFNEYIKDTRVLTKQNYKHAYSHLEYLCDVPNYYDLIADLKIKEFTFIPGEKIKMCKPLLSGQLTKIHSSEINDIITHYVFGRYKDYCIATYRLYKPINPKINFNQKYPQFLLSQIDKMIHLWMANNRSMKLYVIKITVPSNFLGNDESVMYYNPKKRKYEECFRAIDYHNGPTTISY